MDHPSSWDIHSIRYMALGNNVEKCAFYAAF